MANGASSASPERWSNTHPPENKYPTHPIDSVTEPESVHSNGILVYCHLSPIFKELISMNYNILCMLKGRAILTSWIWINLYLAIFCWMTRCTRSDIVAITISFTCFSKSYSIISTIIICWNCITWIRTCNFITIWSALKISKFKKKVT